METKKPIGLLFQILRQIVKLVFNKWKINARLCLHKPGANAKVSLWNSKVCENASHGRHFFRVLPVSLSRGCVLNTVQARTRLRGCFLFTVKRTKTTIISPAEYKPMDC